MARPLFFVHVMKTGGSTFGRTVRAQYGRDEVYPTVPRIDPRGSYTDIRRLLELPAARHETLRAYMGHVPFHVTEQLPIEVDTVLVLREPVARTVSYLRQLREERPAMSPYEELYDDELVRRRLLGNHQTKVLSLEPADRAASYMKVIDVDRGRLDRAMARLEQVAVLGVQDRFDEFLAAVSTRFGWTVDKADDRRVASEREPVSEALLDRIRADVALDAELYVRASELVGARRAPRQTPD